MSVELTHDVLRDLRKAAETPMKHTFPEGIIGAPCSRCGTRKPHRDECLLRAHVSVDRTVLLALIEAAAKTVPDPEPVLLPDCSSEGPWD